ncbi:phasin family protein [Trinickia terrae]|uniref:Phasin family protein n=1 Tax=Trinickia terrae TaxID=2571161 RepID=A0A4U1HND8_9BURK|nr:TIGR01841 family phasin [Trinickia terrae]TKC81713.1 phasin family protein [Trinickia terrae]
MESTNPNNLFNEYAKMIEQFKLPGIDVSSVMESQRKDIEALAAANATALSGIQALGRKQAEILQSTMSQVQSLVTQLAQSGATPQAGAGELVQQALHKALADMQELADTAYRTQSDSFAVVSKRVSEHVEELKALLQAKKP